MVLVPQIHVKVSVFIPDHEDENYNPIYYSFASTKILLQRSNMIERIQVDEHPFVVKYNYPIVDVLYDNKDMELLASVNIDNRDVAEIGATSLNTIGYCVSVEVSKIKEFSDLDFVEDEDSDAYDDLKFTESIRYNKELDNMALMINKCPVDEYTITKFTSSEDYLSFNENVLSEFGCKISEEISNISDILVGLNISPFTKANLKLIRNYYTEYKYWDALIEYQSSLNKG